uniref:WD_REPEATS_REGION domain-containing protein n=1 Tax=Strongyloides papillosus TaxID=174720 RepID=A0A0N5BWK4_STREA
MNIATASNRPLSIEDIIIANAKEIERLHFWNESTKVDKDNKNDTFQKSNNGNKEIGNLSQITGKELLIANANSDGTISFFEKNDDKSIQSFDNIKTDNKINEASAPSFNMKDKSNLNNETVSVKISENDKHNSLKIVDGSKNSNQDTKIKKEKFDFFIRSVNFKNTSNNKYNEMSFVEEEDKFSTLQPLIMNNINQIGKSNQDNKEIESQKFVDSNHTSSLQIMLFNQQNSGKTVYCFNVQHYSIFIIFVLSYFTLLK